eukprot:TRINITY_DN575_c0_g1_i1.p1 TRINITY_DN575_c0_g1~~TRINITY_DN575_c0_g1_i1.p1  ORF type:complete len:571 (-),score=218.79 TRINITY_DN575_c0_g1_i1:67-1779(-)
MSTPSSSSSSSSSSSNNENPHHSEDEDFNVNEFLNKFNIPMPIGQSDEKVLPYHVYENKRVTPVVTENRLNYLMNDFEHKDGDIYICTNVKSGTTFTQKIVLTLKGIDGPLHKTSLWFENGIVTEEEITNTNCRVFKSHFWAENHVDPRKYKNCKFIHVIRNPADMAVSLYHHASGFLPYNYVATWDEFFELFISGQVDFGDYWTHALSWYNVRNDSNVLYLKYEEMVADPKQTIIQIADFLNIEYDDELIAQTIEKSSFENMKKDPSNAPPIRRRKNMPGFFRKGISKDWVNFFNSEQFDRLKKTTQKRFNEYPELLDYFTKYCYDNVKIGTKRNKSNEELPPAKRHQSSSSSSSSNNNDNNEDSTKDLSTLVLSVTLMTTTLKLTLHIDEGLTFGHLADLILGSINYNILNIYSFHMDNEPYSTTKPAFYGELANKQPSATHSYLTEICSDKFLFLYDYAIDYCFYITVEDRIERMEGVQKVISKTGECPPQNNSDIDDDDVYEFEYDDYDDEEDYDELDDVNLEIEEQYEDFPEKLMEQRQKEEEKQKKIGKGKKRAHNSSDSEDDF